MSDTLVQLDEQRDWREAERLRNQRNRRTLIAVLVVLVILLLVLTIALMAIFRPVGKVASTEEAKGVTWIRSIYGWGTAPEQQFWGPQGVAIGPDGTIWATTQGQNRVPGFNPDGSLSAMLYKGQIGNPNASNALTFPTAVAVSPSGLVYIADQPRSRVWILSRDNKTMGSIFVPTPSSVAVNKDTLVVGSASGFVIMTPTGQVVKVLGRQGTGIDQFSGVRGVAIANDGTIFVVDQYNNRVSAWDRNGKRKWILVTGAPGNQQHVSKSTAASVTAAPAQMQIPAGLCIDGAGRLVIADPFGFDLTVLDPSNGKLIGKYGTAGTLDGQFVYPSSVAYDPARDWFAVADSQNGRVQIIRIPGSGGSPLADVKRALTGPLGACLLPLLLILIAIVGGVINRVVKNRRARAAAANQTPAVGEV